MSSRQEQKAQARAAREATERQQASVARRQRRLYGLGGALVVAIAVVVIAVVASSGGDDDKPVAAGSKQAGTIVSNVTTRLRGIPQSGSVLGAASAPVEMVYFGDLQCPVCKDFTEGPLEETIAKQVRQGNLKVRYRAMQTATADQSVFVLQQAAALAAGEQDRLWQYIELFYRQQGEENSGYVTVEHLRSIAEQVPGLDVVKWDRDRKAQRLVGQLTTDAAEAQRVGATGTPTLLVTGPKGTKANSGDSYDEIASQIAEVR